jgi:hypothetical protein
MKDIFISSQAFYKLPKSVNAIITQAERGDLTVKSSLAPDSRKLLVRLEKSINRLSWTIISVGLLMAGITVREGGEPGWVSIVLIVVSMLALGWGLWGNRHR